MNINYDAPPLGTYTGHYVSKDTKFQPLKQFQESILAREVSKEEFCS